MPETIRIPIRPATAATLLALNTAHTQAQAVVDAIALRLHDSLRMLYTEHDIESGRCIEVTETKPHELVVEVPTEGDA